MRSFSLAGEIWRTVERFSNWIIKCITLNLSNQCISISNETKSVGNYNVIIIEILFASSKIIRDSEYKFGGKWIGLKVTR